MSYQSARQLIPPVALLPDQIHVWLVPIECIEIKSSYLDSDELARWQRFYFAKDRQRFLVSHTVLRCLLSHYLAILPTEICYQYSPYHKPAVSNSNWLQFNMSHSAEYVLYGFSQHTIGVDIEKKSAVHDMAAIANRFFSPAESCYLKTLQEQALLDVFYKFWTHKEAWLKCQGTGLHQALSKCEIDPQQQAQTLVVPNTMPCQLSVLPAPEGYAAAVSSTYQEKMQLSLWVLDGTNVL